MKKNNRKKTILIVSVSLVLVAAIVAGIWFGTGRGKAEPVNVYPFNYIGMTEYWGDSQESYGPVTTDKIQTVFLSTTQIVTEVKVSQGDTVKKGDILMTFDTTLSDLELERKRLEVEKLKLDLENAQKKLKEIKEMKPMVIPQFTEPADPSEDTELGTALTEAYRLSTNSKYDGASPETALICWLHSSTAIDDSLLEAARRQAEKFQNMNYVPEPSETTAPTEEPATVPSESTEATAAPTEATQPVTEATQAPTEETQPVTEVTEPVTEATQPSSSASADTQVPSEVSVSSYYMVIKVTDGDMSLGSREVWQGLHVYGQGSGFRFRFFDATVVPDYTLMTEEEGAQTEEPDQPQIDFGSGYTAAQIAQLRSEQEKKIKELQFNIKMTEADYKIMQTEMTDGNVYAQIDGQVVSVLPEDEAKQTGQPMLKVSGGGGFYIEGYVSELTKDDLQLGQEVTVNDWNTGMTYFGTVQSIGDFPSSRDGGNGSGNPNASYYPFTVFVDETADLQAGQYVSVQYSTASGENGIYLENPFIRTEQGQAYVYVQGADGKLEKRAVTTGKSLWGSYTEIRSGLTAEDLIAFPYGKNLKEGAQTVESDLSTLYG